MPIALYYTKHSPPCRAVLLLANDLGLELERKELDLREKKEHMTAEYLKMNTQHSVPTLDDNGFYLWESRAILGYLGNKYGKDDSLYPKDPQKRAIVDQRLYFDIGTLNQRFYDVFMPVYLGVSKEMDQAKLEKVKEALGFLNSFLEGNKWVAGDHKTIADYSISVTVSNILMSVDIKPFPNVARWYDACKLTIKGFQEDNLIPLEMMKKMLEEKLK